MFKATIAPTVLTEALPVSMIESTSKAQASASVVQSTPPKMAGASSYEEVAMMRYVYDDGISR